MSSIAEKEIMLKLPFICFVWVELNFYIVWFGEPTQIDQGFGEACVFVCRGILLSAEQGAVLDNITAQM